MLTRRVRNNNWLNFDIRCSIPVHSVKADIFLYSLETAVDIGGCSGVKIYSRDSWGARQPKSFSTFHTPASLFFIHHTAGHGCHDFDSCAHTLRGIQNYHMDTRGTKYKCLIPKGLKSTNYAII